MDNCLTKALVLCTYHHTVAVSDVIIKKKKGTNPFSILRE